MRFGRVMLAQWALDPAVTYLNHGTVGAPPRRVLAAQQAIRDRIERQPSKFLLRELSSIAVGMPRSEPPLMRDAAAKDNRDASISSPASCSAANVTTAPRWDPVSPMKTARQSMYVNIAIACRGDRSLWTI